MAKAKIKTGGLTLKMIGTILFIFGIVQAGVGAVQYYQFDKLAEVTTATRALADQTNIVAKQTQDIASRNTIFVKCQADYNQAFAKAYQVRADKNAGVLEGIFSFLKTAPPVLRPGSTPAQQQALRDSLDRANEYYARYEASKQSNPLPPVPSQFCGDAPEEK